MATEILSTAFSAISAGCDIGKAGRGILEVFPETKEQMLNLTLRDLMDMVDQLIKLSKKIEEDGTDDQVKRFTACRVNCEEYQKRHRHLLQKHHCADKGWRDLFTSPWDDKLWKEIQVLRRQVSKYKADVISESQLLHNQLMDSPCAQELASNDRGTIANTAQSREWSYAEVAERPASEPRYAVNFPSSVGSLQAACQSSAATDYWVKEANPWAA
ncbi:MAG: hypothetical protein NXY57DRAFT_1016459 [Lentinula lateritia]|nr:MAG: hypothetical protein NXY57DRAFT_1016459 [Lentinula lateritia]